VRKQALFPNSAGRAKLPPATFAVSVKTAGDFFGLFGRPETVYRKTKEVALDVRALPEAGRPPQFTGAVGSFTLTRQPRPKLGRDRRRRFAARQAFGKRQPQDDPATCRSPRCPTSRSIRPKRADNVRALQGDRIGGDKSWEYVIVPKVPGEQRIPASHLLLFRSAARALRDLATGPLALRVTPVPTRAPPSAVFSGVASRP